MANGINELFHTAKMLLSIKFSALMPLHHVVPIGPGCKDSLEDAGVAFEILERGRGRGNFLVTADDEIPCRLQAGDDFFKHRPFDLFHVVSQEVVSQENEMKGPFWKIGEKMLPFPEDPFFQQRGYGKGIPDLLGSEVA